MRAVAVAAGEEVVIVSFLEGKPED